VRFITDHYDADPAYTDPARMLYWEGRAYQVESLKELKEKVAALDDSREYGLVSECAS
jgi:hypothetical protein